MVQRIQLTTIDGLTVAGLYCRVPVPSSGILLLHMMPATKESYSLFAEKLQQSSIGTLAIDFRGHGESTGGPEGYKDFSDQQHQISIEDVRAAVHFQAAEGHAPLFVCGASIGANLALQIITEDVRIKKAILLSAGLEYRGVKTLPLARQVPSDKEVFLIAAKDDVRKLGTCAEQAQRIFDELSCKKEIWIFETGGHGTDLFAAHPELMEELIVWLQK